MIWFVAIALAATADTAPTADTGLGGTGLVAADTAVEATVDTGRMTASMLRGETGGLGCQVSPTGGPGSLLALAGLVVVLRRWRSL